MICRYTPAITDIFCYYFKCIYRLQAAMMNFKCLSWPENYLKRVVTDVSSEWFHTNRHLSYTRAFRLALWQGSGGIYNSPVTDGALTKLGQKEQRCGSAHRVSSVISSSCSEDNTRCVCAPYESERLGSMPRSSYLSHYM